MDINALLKATTVEEMQAALQNIDSEDEPKERAKPRFIDRRFNVIVKKNFCNSTPAQVKELQNEFEGHEIKIVETSETVADLRYTAIVTIHNYEDIPMAVASRWRNDYRKEGFAVDLIETHTTISETDKEIVFTEKNYVPALEGHIPGNAEMSEKRAEQKRIQNHSNMIKKMARTNKVKETVDEKFKIYENSTGNLIFNGDADETIAWIKAHPNFKITEHTVYLPSKIVANLKRQEMEQGW